MCVFICYPVEEEWRWTVKPSSLLNPVLSICKAVDLCNTHLKKEIHFVDY